MATSLATYASHAHALQLTGLAKVEKKTGSYSKGKQAASLAAELLPHKFEAYLMRAKCSFDMQGELD